jgi:hypothetical protein
MFGYFVSFVRWFRSFVSFSSFPCCFFSCFFFSFSIFQASSTAFGNGSLCLLPFSSHPFLKFLSLILIRHFFQEPLGIDKLECQYPYYYYYIIIIECYVIFFFTCPWETLTPSPLGRFIFIFFTHKRFLLRSDFWDFFLTRSVIH